MNDIFHERHMNNIIAADREQNIHVRPTTSTRIGSRASGPRARGPTAIARSRISLVYAACRLMHLKFLAVLRRTRGRTSTQKTAPGACPIEMESARAATSGCSRPQRKGSTPAARRMSVETIGMVWNHKFARVLLIAKLRLECERRGFCAGANGRSRRGQC